MEEGSTADSEVPPEVLAFLQENIESYEQLAILVSLHDRPEQARNVESFATELRIPTEVAERALDILCRRQITVAQKGTSLLFQYRPATPELARLVERLVSCYRDNPLAIIPVMTAMAIERMRAKALTAFADSFLLGRSGRKNG